MKMENEITVQKLEETIDKCFEQNLVYKEAKKEASDEHSQLKVFQKDAINLLEALEKDSYKTARGTFSFRYPDSYKTPKTVEDKKIFAEWLKSEHGEEIFWELFSVNSQSLNSFCREQASLLEEKGEMDPQFPGIEKGIGEPIASMRQSK